MVGSMATSWATAASSSGVAAAVTTTGSTAGAGSCAAAQATTASSKTAAKTSGVNFIGIPPRGVPQVEQSARFCADFHKLYHCFFI
jgi:hypothetical protein